MCFLNLLSASWLKQRIAPHHTIGLMTDPVAMNREMGFPLRARRPATAAEVALGLVSQAWVLLVPQTQLSWRPWYSSWRLRLCVCHRCRCFGLARRSLFCVSYNRQSVDF
ncbi:hypothetical protein BCR37DRAFT_383691 [Protomyces lactucae-debilis]|uniref:Uncharacterized protein n=1 Tax=Protomyces lactucae-debilis TaxID=2754530 RepID=A0A1Y2EY97_PROLT|nr:uncharacterized protein BCR37DRAFT_383691 [Protomyces lactucae-debilis]ORY76076.1 hypothetical protein BCR37DRAFT_383691 [Protomyces lactucae-debilis]